MTASIFWYDFETTGISPSRDRPLQVAGIRTNEELEEIGEPLNLYCRLPDDILPHPGACLITGISPATLQEKGLGEAEFMARLHHELSFPETCVAGYNNLRFDDEVTRYALYRNFYDPYAREWQSGNSRWDLIDLIRTAYALRPDGLNWPEEEGRVTLKLERLTAANGLNHLQAHDALSDVRATIALARLIRERQPRLYDYLYTLRRKPQVMEQICLLEPLVHVSGRFSAERHYLSIVLPLAWHPTNRNALVVCDLGADPSPLWQLDAENLKQRLYTRRDELMADELPVPLKLIHINRCPVVAPLKVLRKEDISRLRINRNECLARAEEIRQKDSLWRPKIALVYQEEKADFQCDPEQQLYAGFLDNRDRRLCEQIRYSNAQDLRTREWPFDDSRLGEMLFRYRGRNFPESLSAEERQKWQSFCMKRLSDLNSGAPNTLSCFEKEARQLLINATPSQSEILHLWLEYVQGLRERYALP
ncbi:exodeoxyribonuclease I [Azomonas macrocytogenes]|uniref:Exodeoxyribonuclease I n=1 Tax=Azomonas macrocytogenes TaxID=69962 RepID=A0A839T4Y4_AZOMA|nr:exodeoxyribonuclease-1 [Azomonas macrocytogenes]